VPLLLLKLTLTPLLIGGASLAARRWGPAIGGWLVALPLTSGPILFFFALDQGPAFAADATVGTLLGLGAICGFCLGYLVASPRGAGRAMAAASVGYVAVGLAVQPVTGAPFPVLVLAVVAAIAGVLRLLPVTTGGGTGRAHPAWDLPARIVVATSFVVLLTTIAPHLVSVLAVFEQVHGGRPGALGVLRGLLVGLFGTVAFYCVIRALVVPAGIPVAFGIAIAVTGVIGAAALRRVRAGIEAPEPESA